MTGKVGHLAGRIEELLAAEEEARQLRGLVRGAVAMLVEGVGDPDVATAVRWLLAGPRDQADQDVVDVVLQAAAVGEG